MVNMNRHIKIILTKVWMYYTNFNIAIAFLIYNNITIKIVSRDKCTSIS